VLTDLLNVLTTELVPEPQQRSLLSHIDSFFNQRGGESNDIGKLLREFFVQEKFFADQSSLVNVMKCVSQVSILFPKRSFSNLD
jgi:hypothetical protein